MSLNSHIHPLLERPVGISAPGISLPSQSPSSSSPSEASRVEMIQPSSSSSLSSIVGSIETSSLSLSSSHSYPTASTFSSEQELFSSHQSSSASSQTRRVEIIEPTSSDSSGSMQSSVSSPEASVSSPSSSDISDEERRERLEHKRTESQGLPLGGGVVASSVLKKTEEDTLILSKENLKKFTDLLGRENMGYLPRILKSFHYHGVHDFEEAYEILERYASFYGKKAAQQLPEILQQYHTMGGQDIGKIKEILKQLIALRREDTDLVFKKTLEKLSILGYNQAEIIEFSCTILLHYKNNTSLLLQKIGEMNFDDPRLFEWRKYGFSKVQILCYLLEGVSLEDAISAEHRSVGRVLTPLLKELLPLEEPYFGQNLPKGIVDLELEYLFTHSPEALVPSSQGSSSSSSSSSGSSSYSSSGPSSLESNSSSSSSRSS